MKLRYKRGDILVSKKEKSIFLLIGDADPLRGLYHTTCYTGREGKYSSAYSDDKTLDRSYRKADATEKKRFFFIHDSKTGYAGLSDLMEKRLFSVMSGMDDSAVLVFKDKTGAERKVLLIGDKKDVGAQHILYKHFRGMIGELTYSDVMFMVEVMKKGDIATSGNDITFTYKQRASMTGKLYKLKCCTRKNKYGGVELVLITYYSNKKKKN